MEFWFLRIGFRPDGRWKLVRVPVFVEFLASGSRLLFQRPSGRKPIFSWPVVEFHPPLSTLS
ncbi:MAG: hypothetical protein HY774_26260 [Acidobacteria bacterium]|nr:hypothetical protein [Acidobacteriota bacterium]